MANVQQGPVPAVTVIRASLFSKGDQSNILKSSGPSAEQQLQSLASGNYWTVLNSHLLSIVANDSAFCL